MGKVRPLFIKKISRELIEEYPNVFSVEFEKNKDLLGKYVEIPSKSVRNRVAGYLTKLMKKKIKLENLRGF